MANAATYVIRSIESVEDAALSNKSEYSNSSHSLKGVKRLKQMFKRLFLNGIFPLRK